MKTVSFDLYRYQLLPITRHAQIDLFHEIRSVEDIEINKNKFFAEILAKLPKFKHRYLELNQKVIFFKNDILCLMIGAQKTIERDNEHFRKERIENWPNVTVIMNNRADVQLIAISENVRAFSSSEVIIKMIETAINNRLKNYQIKMHVEALFDKREFWSIVEKNETKLKSVKFELISPNMANISSSLTIDLKQLNKDTNSHKTNLEFNSPDGATLEINPSNKVINGLVDYASEGGGNIAFKIKGMRKKVHTSKSVKTVEVDELLVENLTYDQLIHFTDLFK